MALSLSLTPPTTTPYHHAAAAAAAVGGERYVQSHLTPQRAGRLPTFGRQQHFKLYIRAAKRVIKYVVSSLGRRAFLSLTTDYFRFVCVRALSDVVLGPA